MKTKIMKKRVLCASLLLALPCSGILFAQEAAPEPASKTEDGSKEATTLDTIVVTADRRTKPLQVTPISATVLTGADLANQGISVVDQLQFSTPSATVNNFGQGIDFNIRGIGKGEHNTQTTTGVITYRDGVATFPGYFTAEPYYDIATLEVLRGPQGTFVGQNATGGAVFVTSNDPVIGGGHTGYVSGQIGNYSDIAAQAALNIPLSDTLAARVAFNGENRDSFWDIDGPYTGSDARLRMRSARLGLLWQPNSNLSVLFKTDYSHLDMGAYPADPVNSPNDLFDITANADLKALDRFSRSVLSIDYEFANGVSFRSISGYQNGNTQYRGDLDGTSAGNSTFRDSVDERIYSQEFNLVSPNTGKFNWIAGAYWQQDTYTFLPGEFVIGVPPGNIFSEYVLQGTNPKQTSAVFGKLGFELSDRFELELGARYSRSRTSNDVSIVQYGTPLLAIQTAEFSNVSGKLALNFQVSDTQFLYAFAATGYRPGGLNVPVGFGQPDPFDEEKVTSYELGWKSIWFDGHLRTQFTAFHNDYNNFQVTIGYPAFPVFGIEMNVRDTTKISGFEAQVQASFGDWKIDAGMGVMHSELGKFYAVDPRGISFAVCDPQTGPASATCIALEGRDQTYAPDFTFNLGIQRDFQVAKGTLTPRINFGHVSEQWATLFQNEARGDRIESRNIVNAQLAWERDGYVWTLYGTNLTDQHYVAAINSGLRFAGAPRQFGLRITKWF
ncbi:MAG TPA: TonB-dependent receptor [Arenimonas sp.]|nr:TonB-dependent receptor [Arenimonas sp.]HOZ05033.1 TonB-dependent receptor [Arenimonas sp.]HPO23935.1 TonB-dependent receptor [Arenimonas sp.]HPW33995.1 TonB-dependent receptor [Arenimonas sp.]